MDNNHPIFGCIRSKASRQINVVFDPGSRLPQDAPAIDHSADDLNCRRPFRDSNRVAVEKYQVVRSLRFAKSFGQVNRDAAARLEVARRQFTGSRYQVMLRELGHESAGFRGNRGAAAAAAAEWRRFLRRRADGLESLHIGPGLLSPVRAVVQQVVEGAYFVRKVALAGRRQHFGVARELRSLRKRFRP